MTVENDAPDPTSAAVDQFITDAMNRGIIPMHVAADLSQYLVEEWSAPPREGAP